MTRVAAWLGSVLIVLGVLVGWRGLFNAGLNVLDRALLGPAS